MKAHYILIAALCGLTGCREDNGAADAANRREMPPLKVSVMNMEQRTVELKSSWFGHLRGVEQADIRPQVSGTLIRQVYWDGSICDKGELLFEIDPATYQAAVDREAANLATARAVKLQAEASLNRVQKDLDRYDKLIKTGAISVKNLTDAQQNLKEMQGRSGTGGSGHQAGGSLPGKRPDQSGPHQSTRAVPGTGFQGDGQRGGTDFRQRLAAHYHVFHRPHPGGFFRDGKTGSQPSDGWNRECENRAHGRHAGF